MRHRLKTVLVAAALTIAATPVAGAQADTDAEVNTFNTLACAMPFLATGYGPIAQCTQLSSSRASGRVGLYSPITGQFQANTDWLDVVDLKWFTAGRDTAGGGTHSIATGYVSLATPYGPAVWSTQYRSGNTEGRWGIVNLITGLFYPGGNGSWTPTSATSRSGSVVPVGGIAIRQFAGAAAVQPNTNTFLTLQLNLCNGGTAGCYDEGRAVPKAREVILDQGPAMVTTNETCERDVADDLFSAMLTLYANEWLYWTFMPAGDRAGGTKKCKDLDGKERGRFGNGVVGRLFTSAGPYFKYVGLLYPDGQESPNELQDPESSELRSFACVDANHVYWGCATHLDNDSGLGDPTIERFRVAFNQCNYLMRAVIPYIHAGDGYHPTAVGGDLNLTYSLHSPYAVQDCVPDNWFRKGDGALQHTMFTNDHEFLDTDKVDMEGTTDHPAWIVVVNRPA